MTLKGDAIFKEKIVWWFEKWHKEFDYFHASSLKSEKLHFDGLILSKA